MSIKRKKRIFISAALLLLLAAGVWAFFQAGRIREVAVAYQPTEGVMSNPGRGFYVQFDTGSTKRMEKFSSEGITLALLAYDIHDYTGEPIGAEKLEELSQALGTARDNGMKVIFRAGYGFESSYQYQDPEDYSQIQGHIGQIAPILLENKDILLCVQAGFLGPWGEWHSSNLLPKDDEESARQVRCQLVKDLESALPGVPLDVRRPRFVRDALEAGSQSPLGVHNDALLSTDDDMGTYDDPIYSRRQELAWMKGNLKDGIQGGEMPLNEEYADAANAVREFEQMHLTYLNSRYNEEVLSSWVTQKLDGRSAFQVIGNRLGYRLVPIQGILPERLSPGREQAMRFKIRNDGFARPFGDYESYAVIQAGKEQILFPAGESPLPPVYSGGILELAAEIAVPETEADAIRVGILIRDQGLPDDPRYNIQLASRDVKYEEGINWVNWYRLDEKGRFILEG